MLITASANRLSRFILSRFLDRSSSRKASSFRKASFSHSFNFWMVCLTCALRPMALSALVRNWLDGRSSDPYARSAAVRKCPMFFWSSSALACWCDCMVSCRSAAISLQWLAAVDSAAARFPLRSTSASAMLFCRASLACQKTRRSCLWRSSGLSVMAQSLRFGFQLASPGSQLSGSGQAIGPELFQPPAALFGVQQGAVQTQAGGGFGVDKLA